VTRRRVLLGAGAASVVLVAGAAAVVVGDGGGGAGSGGAASDTGTAAATAEVTRRDLEEHEEVEGTLGYGDAREITLSAQGTLTALPALGSVIDRGDMVVEVDGRPVPLLIGVRPFWRTLDAGVTDGPDILQLEENLVALGYATPAALTVDQDWTAATTAAVKDWQDALGRDRTGTVAPGDLVFLPRAVRVADWPTPVGGPAGGGVLSVTGTTPVVDVDLDATFQTLVRAGQAVEIVLPDSSTTAGTIDSVGTAATAGEDADGDGAPDSYTVAVRVALDDPAAAGRLDSAPVTVRVVTRAAEGVLAVPVGALLAVSGRGGGDSGYVVEVVGADGRARRVPVEAGAFADGWVEVTGELEEGDEVVVPE
jgi:hypothetical protein